MPHLELKLFNFSTFDCDVIKNPDICTHTKKEKGISLDFLPPPRKKFHCHTFCGSGQDLPPLPLPPPLQKKKVKKFVSGILL